MKEVHIEICLVLAMLFLSRTSHAQEAIINEKTKNKEVIMSDKERQEQVMFIDKFFVPSIAKDEFLKRVVINRSFIKNLPGFIEDAAYQRQDEDGNLIYITIAVWQNENAVNKAKEAVQAEYKKQGFNPAEMMERLKITMDRGSYKEDILP